MEKSSSIQLLDRTFSQEFNLQQFSKFVKELFNNFQIKSQTLPLWKEYQEYIESCTQLGSYEDKSNKVIEVLTVKLKKTESRDRARTMQRNFVAKYLTNTQKDAALVAFYGDNPQDWRFSFVKMNYRLMEVKPGKIKPIEELTPAKRYSFLVGKNEPNYTCRRQFLQLVMEENVNPSIAEIENAFSVENVTKEFFIEYRELYYKLKESLEQIMKNNVRLKSDFEEKGISTVDFAKKLLGQIVFIYFLQKKGWFGINKDDKGHFKEWGTGPKNFLKKLYDKEIVNYDNFFNDILEPLFYEALATPRDDDYYSRFKCKIPFLNGGLFEPINDYDWVETEILLDNKIFGDIFDIFDRYNFTVKEDEPLEKEVAIDPEMLGKVFENLLEIKDRKSKGSYYTPREIVHYMCQRSLINYLETNTNISSVELERFIQSDDFIHDQIIKEKNKQSTDTELIPRSIRDNVLLLDKLLQDIRIIDPAVGSGAFPVGIMNEIVKARSVLALLLGKEKSHYELKRETIENCLYCVDIDSSAIDITKLRFWLSLIVDELDMKKIKPLPNLDHKIMCGNSLLEEFEGMKLFDERLLGDDGKTKSMEELRLRNKIKDRYLKVGQLSIGKIIDDGELREVKKEIAMLEKKLKILKEETGLTLKQQTLNGVLNKRVMESQKKLSELRELQKEFFNEHSRKNKKLQAEKINKLEWELIEETLKEQGNEEAIEKLVQYKKTKSKPFFLWKLYFNEVFQTNNPGFDIVIGNPPYVQLQGNGGELAELYKNAKYQTFTRTGDIYCLFYEKANQILKKGGVACLITSNKWMRAGYGEKLREYLANNTHPLLLVDLGPSIFETATVDTNILLFTNNHSTNSFHGCVLNKKIEISLSDYIRFNSVPVYAPKDGEIWEIRSSQQHTITKKIETTGIPLKKWDLKINFGVKTGYNEAFIIDDKKRDELIAADPKNKQIIKPLIRGRDTSRYTIPSVNSWLINVHNGYIDETGRKVERIKIDEYPSVKAWLNKYFDMLKLRDDQGKTPYNLRDCAYYHDFSKEKIVWKRIGSVMRFSYDDSGAFCLDSTCFATGEKIKYLVGLLNSKVCLYELFRTSPKTGTGDQIISVQALEPLRVPIPSPAQEKAVTKLVEQIIRVIKEKDYYSRPDRQLHVKALEADIDSIVYKMYNLTTEEVKIIEKDVDY